MADFSQRSESNPTVAIAWMFFAGICFVGVSASVKMFTGAMPSPQSAFLRYLLGLIFLLPILKTLLRTRMSRQSLGLFLVRGVAHSIGVTMWFFAMTQIPIAEVTAINYLNPVFVTIGAALFLGERLAFRRIAAIVMALIGALIILRPGLREVAPGHLAMLLTAAVFTVSYLIAGRMSGIASAEVVVAMLSITCTVALAPMAIVTWQPPTMVQLGGLFLVAGLATGGHYSMTRAFASAPLAVTQPVTFLQLIWSALLGWMVFDEALDMWVLLGGAVILGSSIYIVLRESYVKRRSVTPPAPFSGEINPRQ